MSSRIIPFPTELRPRLPTILGNVDYLTFREGLEQIDRLLESSGLERDFVERALKGWLEKAPRSVSAYPGDKSASVHFGQPASDGGSPILSYTITSNPGGSSITVSGRDVLVLGGTHTTFGVVDGLTNGTSYTFTVVANNAAGASPAATTAAVMPAP